MVLVNIQLRCLGCVTAVKVVWGNVHNSDLPEGKA